MTRLTFAAFLFAFGLAASAQAQTGVTADTILVGQTCALKGPAAGLGTAMQLGMQVHFDAVNQNGGIHGRRIQLQSINDGYEPDRCIVATKMLLEKEHVFAMIGGVGTPTAKVALPLCVAAKVPFVGAFTGAELLRSPYTPYAVNIRASYFQETEQLVAWLCDQRHLQRVACFFQDDAYGAAGLAGVTRALERRQLQLVAKGSYKRNTVGIGEGLADVAAGAPEAVILIGAYKPCAEFLKQAATNPALTKAQMCNISFVGTANLIEAAGAAGEGSVVSQVVPSPRDTQDRLVASYAKAMQAAGHGDELDFISLEGYLAARFFCAIVDRLPEPPTREAFVAEVARTHALDIDGFQLSFGDDDNQGSDAVFLTIVHGGRAEPLPVAAPTPGK